MVDKENSAQSEYAGSEDDENISHDYGGSDGEFSLSLTDDEGNTLETVNGFTEHNYGFFLVKKYKTLSHREAFKARKAGKVVNMILNATDGGEGPLFFLGEVVWYCGTCNETNQVAESSIVFPSFPAIKGATLLVTLQDD
jgi:hypothetical protein